MKKIFAFMLGVACLGMLSSCDKDDETENQDQNAQESIFSLSLTCQNVLQNGGTFYIEMNYDESKIPNGQNMGEYMASVNPQGGLCYCEASQGQPTISSSKVDCTQAFFEGQGRCTAELSGLNEGTSYNVRAYIKYNDVVVYSNNVNFTAGGDVPDNPINFDTTVHVHIEGDAVHGDGADFNYWVSGDGNIYQDPSFAFAAGLCYCEASQGVPTYESCEHFDISRRLAEGVGSVYGASISHLPNGVRYAVRGYLKAGGTIIYSDEILYFTTGGIFEGEEGGHEGGHEDGDKVDSVGQFGIEPTNNGEYVSFAIQLFCNNIPSQVGVCFTDNLDSDPSITDSKYILANVIDRGDHQEPSVEFGENVANDVQFAEENGEVWINGHFITLPEGTFNMRVYMMMNGIAYYGETVTITVVRIR